MPEEPITVDCQITSQKFDFDYEIDNTLAQFVSDLQDTQPPMGFSTKKATANEGVFINGNAHLYSDKRSDTLASLGATTNSIIIVSSDVTQA